MSGVDLAVIMAAGQGIRLGEMGQMTPKGLIRLGEQSIIEESVARLRDAGVREVIIVTGHLAERFEPVRQHFAGLVRLVHNAGFMTGGSFASLLCAAAEAKRDILLLESDITYEPRALQVLQGCGWRDVILSSGLTYSSDEVWVATDGTGKDALLNGMSKKRETLTGHIVGELAGISRVSVNTLQALVQAAPKLFEGRSSVDYEDALVSVAAKTGIRSITVDDLVWAEIDTPQMLERVRREVYPRIVTVR